MSHAEMPERFPAGFRFDRYRIESEVVEGPMGRLYKAHDTNLNETIGLYVLSPGLRHPGGVQEFRIWFRHAFYKWRGRFYDYGECVGVPFVAMEHPEGP